ncbi:MAG: hypothetical protein GY820_06395 [Gammaproteobacteria bacterium]|nr:hypothetical protein [Gammaproteobacteria bacterium]
MVQDESKDALFVALEQCVVALEHSVVEVAHDCGGVTLDEAAFGGPPPLPPPPHPLTSSTPAANHPACSSLRR